jgi:hypothetical protein
MKKIRKLVKSCSLGVLTGVIVLSTAVPAFAADPIRGWVTNGTHTGYPYIKWSNPGSLYAATAVINRSNYQMYGHKEAYDYNYVEVESQGYYSDTVYYGYYNTQVLKN